jgi:hypothetical protein
MPNTLKAHCWNGMEWNERQFLFTKFHIKFMYTPFFAQNNQFVESTSGIRKSNNWGNFHDFGIHGILDFWNFGKAYLEKDSWCHSRIVKKSPKTHEFRNHKLQHDYWLLFLLLPKILFYWWSTNSILFFLISALEPNTFITM